MSFSKSRSELEEFQVFSLEQKTPIDFGKNVQVLECILGLCILTILSF